MPRWLMVVIVGVSATLWSLNVVIGWVAPDRAVEGINAVFSMIFAGALALNSSTVKRIASKISEALNDEGDPR